MNTVSSIVFRVLCVISLGVLSGCGANSGTDSLDDVMKDAIEFSKSRIDELEQEQVRTTVQQNDGKWVRQQKELRNARAGMTGKKNPSNQKHEFEVKIKYDFRILSSKPFNTKAEVAEITDQDADWQATTETYVRDGEEWVLKDVP